MLKRYFALFSNKALPMLVVCFCAIMMYALRVHAAPGEIRDHDGSSGIDTSFSGKTLYSVSPDFYYLYEKPKPWRMFVNAPKDFLKYNTYAADRHNLLMLGLVTASSALLYLYDEQLWDLSENIGRRLNISRVDRTKTMVKINGFPVFRGPTDLGSTLYFLGDGWTHISIFASFLGAGLLKSDNRALQTAMQLGEGLLSTALTTQILKRITGRESPVVSTARRGDWRFFPSPAEYQDRQPRYDAFPSGHLATAAMTLTVVSGNYPDYKFIKPLGYMLCTLLGYQMMNNGVHWISDYPVGIAIGYSLGKLAVKRGRTVVPKKPDFISSHLHADRIHFSPVIRGDSGMGIALSLNF